MKTLRSATWLLVFLMVVGVALALGACSKAQNGSLVPVDGVNLSPTSGGTAEALQGLWMDQCTVINGSDGTQVGVSRDGLVLHQDGTFALYTVYFTESDCTHPELSLVLQGSYRTGGAYHGGRAIDFQVTDSGYVAHSAEGTSFLQQECAAASQINEGVFLSLKDCEGKPGTSYTFHSAYRRVSAGSDTQDGILLLGGLKFRPNSLGDPNLKFPAPEHALRHVTAHEDADPATFTAR